mgnify:CR=1 FL=1
MSAPVTMRTSGVSTSNVVPLNVHGTYPFNVSVNAVVTGTVVFSLQFTSDNVQAAAYTPAGGTWQDHPMMSGSAITGIVEFTAPVTAIRLSQASGAGSVAAVAIQMGL